MGDTSWLKNRLSHPDYNNWVKGNLILRELKTGLVPFLEDKARDFQKYVLGHVTAYGTVCTICTEDDLRRRRYICPSAGICTTILQVINSEFTHHPHGTVKLMNSDNQAWCDTARYWEIAKAYISTPGYASKTSAAETDCAGLLTIILNCKWIQSFLSVSLGVFQQVKDLRNALMHSGNNTLAEDQLDKLYDICIQILTDRHCFAVDSTAQAAQARITEIKKKTLSISDVDLSALLFIVEELKAEDDTCREAIRHLETQSASLETRSASFETSSQSLRVWQEELKKQQTELKQVILQLDTTVSIQMMEVKSRQQQERVEKQKTAEELSAVKTRQEQESHERQKTAKELSEVKRRQERESHERQKTAEELSEVKRRQEQESLEKQKAAEELSAVKRRQEQESHERQKAAEELSEVQKTLEKHEQERDEDRRRVAAAVSNNTSSIQNHFGGHGHTFNLGNVVNIQHFHAGGTGNSSTAPDSEWDIDLSIKPAKKNPSKKRKELAEESPSKKRKEHGSGVRMADGSVNHGGSNIQNVFNADLEAVKVCIGQPEVEKNTNSSASGGYNETDTVTTTVHKPGPTTSLAGDLKAEQDNTLAEDIHDAINRSLKSVGRLWLPNSFGTAFRVGSKYAMTNWHVIRDCVDPLKNGQMDFSNLERSNVFITFSADPFLPSKNSFYISSNVLYFDVQLDIAVVELKTDNSINLPPALPLCTEHEECKNVNKLKVLGFGHPESVKKNEEFATVIPPGSPRVMAAETWVQENKEKLTLQCRDMGKDPETFSWDYRGWDDDKNVAIDIYKEKGSSGSPALICADATKVKVMAVVYKGLPDCFWQLPSLLRLAFPTHCRIELAVKMSHIYVSMLNENPTLTKDVFQCGEVDMEL